MINPKLNLFLLSFAMFLAFHPGCSKETRKSFSDMNDLRSTIADHYKEPAPAINLMNGNVLTVTFVNSSFNNLEGQKKKDQAREIAMFVKKNYSGIENIDTINIRLVKQKRLILFTSNQFETFDFQSKEL